MTDATLSQFAAATASVRDTTRAIELRDRPPLSDEARQAIIDARRAMKDARRYAREHRAEIEAEWNALTEPPRTIAGHLAGVSRERRAAAEAEWENDCG